MLDGIIFLAKATWIAWLIGLVIHFSLDKLGKVLCTVHLFKRTDQQVADAIQDQLNAAAKEGAELLLKSEEFEQTKKTANNPISNNQ